MRVVPTNVFCLYSWSATRREDGLGDRTLLERLLWFETKRWTYHDRFRQLTFTPLSRRISAMEVDATPI